MGGPVYKVGGASHPNNSLLIPVYEEFICSNYDLVCKDAER